MHLPIQKLRRRLLTNLPRLLLLHTQHLRKERNAIRLCAIMRHQPGYRSYFLILVVLRPGADRDGDLLFDDVDEPGGFGPGLEVRTDVETVAGFGPAEGERVDVGLGEGAGVGVVGGVGAGGVEFH